MPSKAEFKEMLREAEAAYESSQTKLAATEESARVAQKKHDDLLWSLGLIEVDRLKRSTVMMNVDHNHFGHFGSPNISFELASFDTEFINALLREFNQQHG